MDLVVKWKADTLVLALKRHLNVIADLSFMNSVTGSGFAAKCLNVIVDPSFMNSVTGSGFVAKCSNILQDTTYLSHLWGQNTDRVISICVAQPKVAKVIRVA